MGEESQGRRLIATTVAVVLVALAVGAGAYFIAKSSGEDLDAARQAGAAAGKRIGTAKGARLGYLAGTKAGEQKGYDATYEDAYRAAYEKAFQDAGLDAPSKIVVKGE